MNILEIRDRLDEERRTLAQADETLERLAAITRLRAGAFHSVIFSALTSATADAAIAGEIEHYRRLNVPFEWKVFAHDQPADLRQRLEGLGCAVGDHEAVMVCDLSRPPAWIREAGTSAVVRIERPEQIENFREVQAAAFGRPNDAGAAIIAAALASHSQHHRGYLAYHEGEPVASARMHAHPGSHFAGLYAGSTKPSFRHRGFYCALLAARARDALALHARYLMVDALPTSRPILERLGFHWVTDTWPCEWKP